MAALKPLGYTLGLKGEWGAGFKNAQGAPDFWIRQDRRSLQCTSPSRPKTARR